MPGSLKGALLAVLTLTLGTACAAVLDERIGQQEVGSVKAGLAAVGTLLLALRLLLGRVGSLTPAASRALDGGLLALAVLAAAGWWNFFQFNYPGFGHPSETYHYYVGSKYFPELGYSRLYSCTAVADAEAGRQDVFERKLRDLETNRIVPTTAAVENPEACKSHFDSERWQSFSHDVAWFRIHVTPRRWHQSQVDHGYNGTPAWGFFGRLLAETGPATDRQILALRLLDPILLLLGWGFVGYSFGWRTLCVALLFWGTNYPAQYGWVGGSYLRQLEVVALLVSICLMKRERNVAAGFLLSLAALTRIYPTFLLAGLALAVAGRSLAARHPVLSPSQKRLLAGGLLGAAVLLPLSLLGTGSPHSWFQFAQNSRVLLDTPLRNDMGLRTVLSHDPASPARELFDSSLLDPYEPWKQSRALTFAARRPLFGVVLLGYLALLALAVRRQPDWVALVLGVGLVPMAAELTCYYWVVLVAFALLWKRAPVIGVALCGLSAAGWAIVDRFHFFDEIFAWQSLAGVLFALFATTWVWLRPIPTDSNTV
jgi:hypothetical protein